MQILLGGFIMFSGLGLIGAGLTKVIGLCGSFVGGYLFLKGTQDVSTKTTGWGKVSGVLKMIVGGLVVVSGLGMLGAGLSKLVSYLPTVGEPTSAIAAGGGFVAGTIGSIIGGGLFMKGLNDTFGSAKVGWKRRLLGAGELLLGGFLLATGIGLIGTALMYLATGTAVATAAAPIVEKIGDKIGQVAISDSGTAAQITAVTTQAVVGVAAGVAGYLQATKLKSKNYPNDRANGRTPYQSFEEYRKTNNNSDKIENFEEKQNPDVFISSTASMMSSSMTIITPDATQTSSNSTSEPSTSSFVNTHVSITGSIVRTTFSHETPSNDGILSPSTPRVSLSSNSEQ
jgi:hypothetical protein